jgi:hypothetical protein
MPAMPGPGFIVIQPKRGLGYFKALFDRPAMALHRDQCLNPGAGGTPGREVGPLAIVDAAPDQQAAGPSAGARSSELGGIEISQFEIRPVIQPRPFGAVPGRQAPPRRWLEPLRNGFGRAAANRRAVPRMELMV